jgi:hypothetical protein
VRAEQAAEDGPQLEHRWHLLKRQPARLQRERPAQRLDGEERARVPAVGQVPGARVVARGQLVRAGDHERLVVAAEALAGGRPGLARRRADQAPDGREVERVEGGEVGLDPLVPGRPRRRARPRIAVDADGREPQLTQALVPAARPGEEIDDPAAHRRPPLARKRAR